MLSKPLVFLCLLLIGSPAAAQTRPSPEVIEHMRGGLQARKEQRWDDAAREFEAAARLAPRLAEAYANLGLVRQRQGNMAAAAA
ncbi:MAG: tetratricopeptide repeat protein, partial [bacterium]|nr:tetratricopeptide repeat protein [bacterium]